MEAEDRAEIEELEIRYQASLAGRRDHASAGSAQGNSIFVRGTVSLLLGLTLGVFSNGVVGTVVALALAGFGVALLVSGFMRKKG